MTTTEPARRSQGLLIGEAARITGLTPRAGCGPPLRYLWPRAPMLLSDPGMWPFVFDPELLALVVITGAFYKRLEFASLQRSVPIMLDTERPPATSFPAAALTVRARRLSIGR